MHQITTERGADFPSEDRLRLSFTKLVPRKKRVLLASVFARILVLVFAIFGEGNGYHSVASVFAGEISYLPSNIKFPTLHFSVTSSTKIHHPSVSEPTSQQDILLVYRISK